MMRERPILFSASMIRAILDGSKTQTRRIAPVLTFDINTHDGCEVTWALKFSNPTRRNTGGHACLSSYSGGVFTAEQAARIVASQFCRHGAPGDRLWVREAWSIVPRTAYALSDGVPQIDSPDADHDAAIFRASFDRSQGGIRWRPSIHMPRWASRITLAITGVRLERLQDISEADALAEGVNVHPDHHGKPRDSIYSPVQAYRDLWDQINGAGAWAANPWTWAIEFQRVTP